MADITLALAALVPAAKYGGYPRDREHYEALAWRDARPKPSWAEIETQLAALEDSAFVGRIASRRYDAETAGATWNGLPVATDRQSQAVMGNAYKLAQDGHWQDGSVWKFADGVPRGMTAQQVMAMALTIAAYVQACFEVEAQKLAAHTAGAVVDIEEGWPSGA